jgi:hypothetical protein
LSASNTIPGKPGRGICAKITLMAAGAAITTAITLPGWLAGGEGNAIVPAHLASAAGGQAGHALRAGARRAWAGRAGAGGADLPAMVTASVPASGTASPPATVTASVPASGTASPPATVTASSPATTRLTAATAVASRTPRQIALAMLLHRFHWQRWQFSYLDRLWTLESGWNRFAANPYSGAYGIPQALPGSKMASAGPDWRSDARTQILWGLRYIRERYGSPYWAWQNERAFGWY